jgi:hypothetical protein
MKPCLERLSLALGQDSSIACTPSEVDKHSGHSEEYLVQLGLEKQDLPRLMRMGLALRGYLSTRQGYRTRWIILRPEKSVT